MISFARWAHRKAIDPPLSRWKARRLAAGTRRGRAGVRAGALIAALLLLASTTDPTPAPLAPRIDREGGSVLSAANSQHAPMLQSAAVETSSRRVPPRDVLTGVPARAIQLVGTSTAAGTSMPLARTPAHAWVAVCGYDATAPPVLQS